MFKNLIRTAFAVIITSSITAAYAAEVKLINTGGKNGGYSREVLALEKDMQAANLPVQVFNPGNLCVAAQEWNTTTQPALIRYGSGEHEEAMRKSPECEIKFEKEQVVIHYQLPHLICGRPTASLDLFDGKDYKIAISPEYQPRIDRMNQLFGTKHVGVPYAKRNDRALALQNGEVDFVIFPATRKNTVTKEGGVCVYHLDGSNYPNSKSLYLESKQDPAMYSSYHAIWVAKNMTPEQFAEISAFIDSVDNKSDTALGGLLLKAEVVQDFSRTQEEMYKTFFDDMSVILGQ